MGLRDVGATLPPGFRFYPSDQELVCHYLRKKISNEEVSKGTLVEIDLHICEPWQLPEVAKLNSKEWYFFSFRDRKYATGYRTNRATTSGYWKATGKDRVVVDPRTRGVVGMRKTLVFYRNRAPNGIKTGWIMHEFRLENPNTPPKEDWVLCRVFHKAKSESSSHNKFSPLRTYSSEAAVYSPPSLAATTSSTVQNQTDHHHHHRHASRFTTSQSPPDDHHHHGHFQNPSSSSQLMNYMQLSPHQELNTSEADPMKTQCREEDDFGFLLDLGFQEPNLTEIAPSCLDHETIAFDQAANSIFR